MKIESLQELKALIALCKKTGVSSLKLEALELNIELDYAQPKVKPKRKEQAVPNFPFESTQPFNTENSVDVGQMTDEQRLFWSADASQPTDNLA